MRPVIASARGTRRSLRTTPPGLALTSSRFEAALPQQLRTRPDSSPPAAAHTKGAPNNRSACSYPKCSAGLTSAGVARPAQSACAQRPARAQRDPKVGHTQGRAPRRRRALDEAETRSGLAASTSGRPLPTDRAVRGRAAVAADPGATTATTMTTTRARPTGGADPRAPGATKQPVRVPPCPVRFYERGSVMAD